MPGDGWPDFGLFSELPVRTARALVGVIGDVGLVGERGGAITVREVTMVGEICDLETEAAVKILRRVPSERRLLFRVDLLFRIECPC